MARVLARRDDNWKRMQQYVLDERETFQILGAGGAPFYGFRREYPWFPRDGDGVFVRSPLTVDGVKLGEAERRKAEADYLKREERRDKRRDDQEKDDAEPRARPSSATEVTGDGVRQALEPGFVSAAYFLKFKFDPGQYALAGRETLEGRPVLRIEYYPTKLFSEGRARPNRKVRERDVDIEPKMNKAALVTLWIEPAAQQILKYEFRNLPWDFLPGRAIVRVDERDGVDGDGPAVPRRVAAARHPDRHRLFHRGRRAGRPLRHRLSRLPPRLREHEDPVMRARIGAVGSRPPCWPRRWPRWRRARRLPKSACTATTRRPTPTCWRSAGSRRVTRPPTNGCARPSRRSRTAIASRRRRC